MSFDNLGLSAELLRAVSEQGYTEPTPIQQRVIPVVLRGHDVMATAQTGTGKTAGFTLPMLQRLNESTVAGPRRPVRALVLTPTRELAAQVGASVETYGKHLPLKAAVIFGGVGLGPQIQKLRRGVDILVATPGRLLDHARQKNVDLSGVEVLVLDEADRMLDMGFIPDIRRIIAMLPGKEQRQNLLFSATFSDQITQLARQLLTQPEQIDVAPRNATVDAIDQLVHPVDKGRKREMLSHMIGAGNWRQVLVFTRTKHGANRLAKQLDQDGLSATAIHGNKSQGARTRALAEFKDGTVRVLVATDIAARGLDISELPHVVNYELPNVPEDYVHRIGRTGRAGRQGTAVSLVSGDERGMLRDIERMLRRDLPRQELPGYEVGTGSAFDPDDSSRRERRPQNGRQRSNGSRPAAAQSGNGRGNGGGNAGGRGKPRNRSGKGQSNQTNGRSAGPVRNGRDSRGNGAGLHGGGKATGGRTDKHQQARPSKSGNRASSPPRQGYSSLAGRMFNEVE